MVLEVYSGQATLGYKKASNDRGEGLGRASGRILESKMTSKSPEGREGAGRRERRAAEKEYRDFLFDVESSAKRILRDVTKRKQAEAVRAKFQARQQHDTTKAGSKRPRPGQSSSPGGNRPEVGSRGADEQERRLALPENDREITLEIPLPKKFLPPKHGTPSNRDAGYTQSLPDLNSPAMYKPKSTSTAAVIIARVKQKLADSPLQPKSEAFFAGQSKQQLQNERAIQQQERSREQEHMMARKPKLVDVVSKNSGNIIKLKGHFAPGTVPPRAEHAVPRRLALSAWLNPNKPSAVDRGLSDHALKALTQANELQGPTNWASVDLRGKYRDEKQRTQAWMASLERLAEAERLQREQQIYIPVVTIGEHPVHIDYKEWIVEENIDAAKRARARNRLKTFAYDLPVIWNANRPENPILELEHQAENAQRAGDKAYPPVTRGVNGVAGRRDVLAHEGHNCQVQSVTPERAIEGAVRVSEFLKHSGSESSLVQKKLEEMQRLRSEAKLKSGASVLERVQARERRLHRAQDSNAIFRAIVLGRSDGTIMEGSTSEADADAILISVFKDETSYALQAYSFSDSSEFATDVLIEDFERMIQTEIDLRAHEQDDLKALHEERMYIESEMRQARETEAREHEMALWWYAAMIAAERAHFQTSEDVFAELVGYSYSEARASAARVEQLLKRNLISPKLASVVHRQCIRVSYLRARVATGEVCPCALIAALAAVEEQDLDSTCIVLHLRRLDNKYLEPFGFCFSVSALRKWMQDTSLIEQIDLPPPQLKWWLLASEWRTQLFKILSSYVSIDLESGRSFIPGLELAQGALQYERMRRATESVQSAILDLPELPPLDSLPALTSEQAIQKVLFKGFGLVQRLWERKRMQTRRDVKSLQPGDLEASGENITVMGFSNDLPMALAICGRRFGDPNYIGCDPPSTSMLGRTILTPVLFTRDPQISSTNSVTCVLMTALDSPILVPILQSFDPRQLQPVAAKEYLDLPKFAILTAPPQVIKRVISKLDFREAYTIVVLNSCAVEADLGVANGAPPGEVTDIMAGHRRLDPEMTPHYFRAWVLARREELCIPDPHITSTVFGVTQSSATLNAPDTWPHRYTWHSDELVTLAITRPRDAKDFADISHRGATVGSNDPNAYQSVMTVYDERYLQRRPRTKLVKELAAYEERVENQKSDELMITRLEAAAKSKKNSEEARILLEQELNDKRLRRERELRGKSKEYGGGASLEDWKRRLDEKTTRKLGRWRSWQAYLYLDTQAKEIVRRAAQQVELDQLARIAAGKRPKPRKVIEEEAFSLAVREGTLFYHHQVDNIFQWDQPEGWQGVASVPAPEEEDPHRTQQEMQREVERQSHNLRGDEGGLTEDNVGLDAEFDAQGLGTKPDNELKKLQQAGAAHALEAARQVEHSRRLRFIEENVRTWMDMKAGVSTVGGVFDLRVCFQEMDENRTGVLSYPEFKMGIANNALEIPVEDQDTLIKHLDKENNGVVDYIEFVHWAIYTRPNSMYQWMQVSMDLPDLGPNTWAKMQAKDKLLSTVALHEEYKEMQTGQHYYYSLHSGEFSWVMPEVVAQKKREDRDAHELRQAQVAAALAAKAAAVSAAQAERASDRSMQRIVEHLTTSADFVQLVAEELGLKQLPEKQVLPPVQDLEVFSPIHEGHAKHRSLVPHLLLGGRSSEASSMASSERSDSSSYSDSSSASEIDDDGIPRAKSTFTSATAATIDVELASRKPGVEWRGLRAKRIEGAGFVTKASTPITRGADPMVYNVNFNRPSLVGVVDPADVSHVPFEDFPAVETKFIADILEDALRGTAMTKEDLLDKSDEEEMIELTMNAFLAVKNLNMAKLEESLELGVQVGERDENGNTLFILAVQQGSKRFAKFLLRRGADINAQNLQGNTALHYCFQYSFNELAEYLISKGADDSLLNKDGLTAYEGLNKSVVANM